MTVNVRMTVTTAVACVLASIDLLPLFSDSLWFVIAIGAVAVVAGTGMLTRLRPLPAPACLLAGVAALLLYLNLIFEVRHSWVLVIPTPGSLSRLWDLIVAGLHDASRYAPPAPDRPGLLLLAAGGVGITAVAADLIAARLRSTALAGLPLLILFTVPVMMNAPHDQLTTGLGFCLGGAGYLAMLSADGRERIRVWGRLISLWRPAPRYGGFQPPQDDGAGFDGTGPGEVRAALQAAELLDALRSDLRRKIVGVLGNQRVHSFLLRRRHLGVSQAIGLAGQRGLARVGGEDVTWCFLIDHGDGALFACQ